MPGKTNLNELGIPKDSLYETSPGGVMLVTGPPASGLDLFAHFLAWRLKKLFEMEQMETSEMKELMEGKEY